LAAWLRPNIATETINKYTAKTKCRKFETNIPRKRISGPQSQFPHSCVSERIIYVFPRWVCLFCWRKYVRHMNVEIEAEAALFPEKEYINGIAVAV
jgi:hypothetical protein